MSAARQLTWTALGEAIRSRTDLQDFSAFGRTAASVLRYTLAELAYSAQETGVPRATFTFKALWRLSHHFGHSGGVQPWAGPNTPRVAYYKRWRGEVARWAAERVYVDGGDVAVRLCLSHVRGGIEWSTRIADASGRRIEVSPQASKIDLSYETRMEWASACMAIEAMLFGPVELPDGHDTVSLLVSDDPRFRNSSLTIAWGDGAQSNELTAGTFVSHVYSRSGVFRITLLRRQAGRREPVVMSSCSLRVGE